MWLNLLVSPIEIIVKNATLVWVSNQRMASSSGLKIAFYFLLQVSTICVTLRWYCLMPCCDDWKCNFKQQHGTILKWYCESDLASVSYRYIFAFLLVCCKLNLSQSFLLRKLPKSKLNTLLWWLSWLIYFMLSFVVPWVDSSQFPSRVLNPRRPIMYNILQLVAV